MRRARFLIPTGLMGLAAVSLGMAALFTDRLVYLGVMLIIFTCFSELATCGAALRLMVTHWHVVSKVWLDLCSQTASCLRA